MQSPKVDLSTVKPLTRRQVKALISDRLTSKKTTDPAFVKLLEFYLPLLTTKSRVRVSTETQDLASQLEAAAKQEVLHDE